MAGAEALEGQYHYSAYHLGERPLSPQIQRVYDAFGTLPEGSWVLDLGSGPGRFAMRAPKPRPFRVLGVDLSPIAIAQFTHAISLDGRVDEARVADITRLDLPDREFRGAVSWRVKHSLDPQQQLAAMAEARRLLTPGALYFVAVASDTDWKAQELMTRGEYVPGALNECRGIMGLGESFRVDFLTPDRLEELARRSGFRVESIEPFEEPTGFKHLEADHPINNYLLAHLERAA